MANFVQSGDNYKVTIPSWKDVDKTTYYEISVEIEGISWLVLRRYSEFAKLHSELVSDHGVQVDILPPKKIIGNRDENFIETRRQALEEYLSAIVRFLQKAMPKKLAIFLKFQQFDVTFIIKNLAVNFYQCGELILTKLRSHIFTPLELFAISERLKQPCSSLDLIDQREDFSHVLDFCYQLTDLVVNGSETPIEHSNIVPNNLPLNFQVFKSLETLTLNNVNCELMAELGSLRLTLRRIRVKNCRLSSLVELLLSDQVHRTSLDHHNDWNLTDINVTNSQLNTIDESLQLAPKLKTLSLDDNKISSLCKGDSLQTLASLSLAQNCLTDLDALDASKLVFLDISENMISTLKPFSSLISLETLNVQINRITEVAEVDYISQLQYLENLVLTGNPVAQIVDYRIKVLEYFGQRACMICLDNESTNQMELDKVAIMSALHRQRKSMIAPS